VADSDSAVWQRFAVTASSSPGTAIRTSSQPAGHGPGRQPWALDRHAGRVERRLGRGPGGAHGPGGGGTDTAGSLRIPAALCGISSIKPTYGRVGAEGCIPLSPTLDHPGPWRAAWPTRPRCCARLATEPGRDPDPIIAQLPLRARAGRAARRAARRGHRAPRGGRRRARRPRRSAGRPRRRRAARCRVVELPAPPDVAPEDSVTILFHEVWPYHAALAERRDRYRPSIREFVDLPARCTTRRAMRPPRPAAPSDRAVARVVRRPRRRPPARAHRARDGVRRAGTATTRATSAARATR
jgi:hypothetical protein